MEGDVVEVDGLVVVEGGEATMMTTIHRHRTIHNHRDSRERIPNHGVHLVRVLLRALNRGGLVSGRAQQRLEQLAMR
jgi:hypothetical protein